ncbi:MAG: hypothetical protein L6R36_006684 [Xanthoria steineri]|nr:MAG: hypothetical protein L6R36_006684 [Xanthoria steineri]
MASFLCPRTVAAPNPLYHTLKQPSNRIAHCLRNVSRPTRDQRPPSISQWSLSTAPCRRTFTSSSSRRAYKTVEQAKSQHRTGPFSPRSAVLFLTVGAGLWFYLRYEKERLQRKKIADSSKGVGKPKVGGKFEMIDQEGRPWTEQNIKGGFTLVYFGFTHCPDICPEELDKMSRIIDLLNGPPNTTTAPIPPPPPPLPGLPNPNPTTSPTTTDPTTPPIPTDPTTPQPPRPPILPLFISCDPARDTPSVLKEYLSEFHPSLVGLTGTWQQVKDMCRAYRVYFSTPEGVKPGQDYLVDHSIYFYVMDPDGDFIECIGRQHTPESGAKIIKDHMSDWKNGIKLN